MQDFLNPVTKLLYDYGLSIRGAHFQYGGRISALCQGAPCPPYYWFETRAPLLLELEGDNGVVVPHYGVKTHAHRHC